MLISKLQWFIMTNSSEMQYESIKEALEGVGLKVDKIQKKGKKTVITISPNEIKEEIICLENQTSKKMRLNDDK